MIASVASYIIGLKEKEINLKKKKKHQPLPGSMRCTNN
jgi:hypothetical protein